MNSLYNLARVTTATTGTGTITLGAAISGFLTFAQAGVPDGAVVTYAIADGANAEIGQGTYTLSGTTLSRDTVYRSTGAGNTGKITLSGSAQVFITAAAEDITSLLTTLGTVTTGTWSAGTVGSSTDSSAAIPASTTTAGWRITSNYAGGGETNFWNTVNGSAGFFFYQKTGSGTFQQISGVIGDATFSEHFLSQGVNNAWLGLYDLEVYTGTNGAIPYNIYTSNVLRVSIPATGGGLTVVGTTSGGVTIKVPAVAGTNTITFPAGTTDFSATGGAGQFVKQASAGAAFTVSAPTVAEIAGFGANVTTFLGTPSSANLAAAVTDETGSGPLVFSTSPAITTPNIVGTATNNNAAAGSVGESQSAGATAVSVVTATAKDIVTLSLTAGDWDVEGFIKWNPAATTTSTLREAGLGALSANTLPTSLAIDTAWARESGAITTGNGPIFATGVARLSLSGTTTIRLVGKATFATSTMTADGFIKARRRR